MTKRDLQCHIATDLAMETNDWQSQGSLMNPVTASMRMAASQ